MSTSTSSTSSSSPTTSTPYTKPTGSPEASPADLGIWSTFLGRSESMNKQPHPRTTSTSSTRSATRPISDLIRGELDDEATIDTILAPYHERRRSHHSEAGKAVVGPATSSTVTASASPVYKTAHGPPPRAILNRLGSFVGNLVDGSGWRRS